MTFRRWYIWLLLGVWILALGLAALVDRQVAQWVHDAHPIDRHSWLVRLVRLPGNYVFLIAVALFLVLFHRRSWQAAVPLLLSGPLVGMVYLTIKWIIGRQRPVIVIAPFTVHPFTHGFVGLFRSVSGLSFPSGDATMAFAAAGCMAAVFPRWSVAFFLAAIAVAVERVLENAHYVSDVVGGAGFGILCAYWAVSLSRRLFPPGAARDLPVVAEPKSADRAELREIRTCARES